MITWYIDNAAERAALHKNFHVPSKEAIANIRVSDFVRLQIFFVRKIKGEEEVSFSRNWVEFTEILEDGSYVGLLTEDSEHYRRLKENSVMRFTGANIISIDTDE